MKAATTNERRAAGVLEAVKARTVYHRPALGRYVPLSPTERDALVAEIEELRTENDELLEARERRCSCRRTTCGRAGARDACQCGGLTMFEGRRRDGALRRQRRKGPHEHGGAADA